MTTCGCRPSGKVSFRCLFLPRCCSSFWNRFAFFLLSHPSMSAHVCEVWRKANEIKRAFFSLAMEMKGGMSLCCFPSKGSPSRSQGFKPQGAKHAFFKLNFTPPQPKSDSWIRNVHAAVPLPLCVSYDLVAPAWNSNTKGWNTADATGSSQSAPALVLFRLQLLHFYVFTLCQTTSDISIFAYFLWSNRNKYWKRLW